MYYCKYDNECRIGTADEISKYLGCHINTVTSLASKDRLYNKKWKVGRVYKIYDIYKSDGSLELKDKVITKRYEYFNTANSIKELASIMGYSEAYIRNVVNNVQKGPEEYQIIERMEEIK